MKITHNTNKLHNLYIYLLYCFSSTAFLTYCLFYEAEMEYVVASGTASAISYIASVIAIFLNNNNKNLLILNKLPYLIHSPSKQSISVSLELENIVNSKLLLEKTILLPKEESMVFREVLDKIEQFSLKQTPLIMRIARQEKSQYYKLSLQNIGNNIAIFFIDISAEYIEYESTKLSQQNNLSQKELLKNALDHIPVALWIRNKDMEIIYFNNMYSQIVFGKDKPFDKHLIEIDKIARNNAKEAFSKNKINAEERYIITDGKRHLYQFTDIPVSKENVVSIGYNISSKDAIQKELQESIEAQVALLESTSNACVIYGPDRKLKFYNRAFIKFWDVDEKILDNNTNYEDTLDHLYTNRKLPEMFNYAKFRQERIDLFTNITSPIEDLFYLPDGRCFRSIVIPHTSNSLLFTYEDMTDKLALESLYNTLYAVQQSTIDHLQEGVCVFNQNGNLEIVNPKMISLWEITQKSHNEKTHLLEILEKISGKKNDESALELTKNNFAKAMSKRVTVEQTLKGDGKKIIHRVIVPLPNGAILVSDLDVTDSKVAEKALYEKNQALSNVDKIKSRFLANMSYELRSPLTSIIGITQLLLRHNFEGLTNKQKEYLNDIINSTQHLSGFVDDAIELTSIDSGYAELEVKEFDCINVINAATEVCSASIKTKNLSLSFEHNIKQAPCSGDMNKIKQVIVKLIENAIHRSKDEGEIKISIADNKKSYLISVIYNGIKLEDKETGLDIALAKGIIEMHQGNIECKSQKNNSTAFIITLPKDINSAK